MLSRAGWLTLDLRDKFPCRRWRGRRNCTAVRNELSFFFFQFAFFDCPTEGIDSDSRNVIWDAILKCRAQTTVLLATNSTDEAEILGDRIAIISRSLISCCGSAIYLRKKYGQGYRLQLAVSSKCDKSLVCSFIEKRLSTAQKVLERRNILVYSLGFTDAADIVRLLQQLEDSRIKLRVRRLSVSASSLEDVLLRLGPDALLLSTRRTFD
ncbi:cholesterol transporter ABCA5-like [Dermacentor andersoni]|uniref:cholesterol transporter ABCA5-like n=1 Tax=Dermacentor andersoni TaxID=34620 RepID=UPI003B3AA707